MSRYRNAKQLAYHRECERRRRAAKPPEWYVWGGMKQRCTQQSHKFYENYGGKGITVDPRWTEHGTGFQNFLDDMGPRPSPLHDLDRKKSEKNYCKENCRWLHRKENRGRPHIKTPLDPKQLAEVDEYEVQPEDNIE